MFSSHQATAARSVIAPGPGSNTTSDLGTWGLEAGRDP